MASLVFAMRGWRVIYLGLETPVEELAAVAGEAPLEAVALSVSATAPRAYAFALALDLRRKLPEGVTLWIGGKGDPASVPGAVRIDDLNSLDRLLAGSGSP